MKNLNQAAFVVSVHYVHPNGPARLNLKWNGNHQISDFDLDRLGEVLNCETETENTGWVMVRSSHLLNDSSMAPLSQFGHLILRSSNLVGPGEEIPLRPETNHGFVR
jgi:hypothetical protein